MGFRYRSQWMDIKQPQDHNKATTLFQQMWLEWKSALPETLLNESPITLIRLLELGGNGSGLSQSVAQRELGIKQSRLSKLMGKLLDHGWITVARSTDDARPTPMETTVIGQKWLSDLQTRLNRLQTLYLEAQRSPNLLIVKLEETLAKVLEEESSARSIGREEIAVDVLKERYKKARKKKTSTSENTDSAPSLPGLFASPLSKTAFSVN